jgi:hypothetical protein
MPFGMVLALAMATLAWGEPAWSQTLPASAEAARGAPAAASAGQSSAAPPAAAVDATPRSENPGLIDEIGKLFERRPTLFPALKLPLPAAEGASAPSNDAGEGLPNMSLPGSNSPSLNAPSLNSPSLNSPSSNSPGLKVPSFEKGREKCPVADNGASDCKAAADALCRAKGYQQGRSTDTDATQRCSAEALLLSGRKSAPGACRTDYFVTRAWCQ